MNKIININLGGRMIPIDEIAYESLRRYIDWLRHYFGREAGGEEIVQDMEARISELFELKLKNGHSCILQEDVDAVIGIMGSPEQIASEDSEPSFEAHNMVPPYSAPRNQEYPKRLFRSEKNKVFGGVCSGIASYFNMDPVIVRVAFFLFFLAYGTGILAYLILWVILPTGNEPIRNVRRRLYRNPHKKVLAGVCSGLGAYFDTDTVIIRIAFVSPLFLTILFGALTNDSYITQFFAVCIPLMFLLYIVLWISVPQARTIAEKLEMEGERVDVQNLKIALQNDSSAPLQYIAPPRERTGSRIIVTLFKLLACMALGFLLVIVAFLLISVIGALIGVYFTASLTSLSLADLIIHNDTMEWVLWVSLILLLIAPLILIFRLLVRIISGRKHQGSKWINISLLVLFILGLSGTTWVGSSIAGDFKVKYRKSEEVAFMPLSSDTLILEKLEKADTADGVVSNTRWMSSGNFFGTIDGNKTAIRNVDYTIEKSPDSAMHMMLRKSAYGNNSIDAARYCDALRLEVKQEGNKIILPDYILLTEGHPFRGQSITVEIQIPEGKHFIAKGFDYGTLKYARKMRKFHYDYWDYEDDVVYKVGKDSIWQQNTLPDTLNHINTDSI